MALVLINSWGAFYLALVGAQNVANPLAFVIAAMPYTLYCWISLALVAFVMSTGFTVGPMRGFEAQVSSAAARPVSQENIGQARQPRLRHMLIPIVALIGGVFLSLWSTGKGDIAAGDGSSSILYAVIGAS